MRRIFKNKFLYLLFFFLLFSSFMSSCSSFAQGSFIHSFVRSFKCQNCSWTFGCISFVVLACWLDNFPQFISASCIDFVLFHRVSSTIECHLQHERSVENVFVVRRTNARQTCLSYLQLSAVIIDHRIRKWRKRINSHTISVCLCPISAQDLFAACIDSLNSVKCK